MLLSEAIDYVSYFMDIKKADGAFAEAWSIIFKELAEGQKPTTNISRVAIVALAERYCDELKLDDIGTKYILSFARWARQHHPC